MGAPNPELAAIGDIPAGYCRVLASRIVGDRAYVLLDTGSESSPYPYGVDCVREGDLWYEAGGGNGCSWSSTSDDDEAENLGFLAWWSEAPDGSDMVRIRFLGEEHDVPVENGYYLFVVADVPGDVDPEVVSHRIEGAWKRRPRREVWGERAARRAMHRMEKRARRRWDHAHDDDL